MNLDCCSSGFIMSSSGGPCNVHRKNNAKYNVSAWDVQFKMILNVNYLACRCLKGQHKYQISDQGTMLANAPVLYSIIFVRLPAIFGSKCKRKVLTNKRVFSFICSQFHSYERWQVSEVLSTNLAGASRCLLRLKCKKKKHNTVLKTGQALHIFLGRFSFKLQMTE